MEKGLPTHGRRTRRTGRRWVLAVVPLLVLGGVLQTAWTVGGDAADATTVLTPDAVKQILLDTPSNDSAAAWLRYYTSGPHLAGANLSQAEWTRDRWSEWGAASHIAAYETYLNYPAEQAVSLLERTDDDDDGWTETFRASLREDVVDEDATTALADGVPTFHGYAASGNATGAVVYANYGTYQDFADLQRANVSVAGAVVLVRYGGIFRGLKVKRAQELGAVGVLMYSDPGDDEPVTEQAGLAPYPDGPARQPSSVQRGSVQFLSVSPGDPTTPGYPSLPGAPRTPTDRYIPQIPSVPLSYADALPLLSALNGHGPSSRDLGTAWTRREGLRHRGVQYCVGPSTAHVHVHSAQRYTTTPIWNVLGVFNGSSRAREVVVVGNHRDAWVAGGAVDPNSGSAVVNEVVRALGRAYATGWRPQRTVVFASWDGEEYGLLGSTEWVEHHLPWLSAASVAYVNIDTGVGGTQFGAAAVPLVHRLVHDVAGDVLSPNQTVPGTTVGDTWSGRIAPLGSGSDYTAFLDHAGIASLDVHFGAGAADPVYHYHSNYDSFHWMATYGDPGFHYHVAMAQILGLLVARLATETVIPFVATDYAHALHTYVDKIRHQAAGTDTEDADTEDTTDVTDDDDDYARLRGRVTAVVDDLRLASPGRTRFAAALDRLDAAVADFAVHASALDARADELRARIRHGALDPIPGPCWAHVGARLRRAWLAHQVAAVNRRYQYLERHFLYHKGLDGREWFKHVIFAPGLWTGYAGAVFPGLVETIDAADWGGALRWAGIIHGRIHAAAKTMR